MHGLFFDVRPKSGHMPRYFEHVDRLKPVLAAHDGLMELERFTPLDDPEALLSHQIWRSDADIAQWRKDATHRASQAAGQRLHFEGYRIRVGPVVSPPANGWPEVPNTGRHLLAVYADAPLGPGRAYSSITTEGRFLTLFTPDTAADMAEAWAATAQAQSRRIFDIARDYTMTERAEAPQPAA